MAKINDGGPVFPNAYDGLTKRELFAAMAMQGLSAKYGSTTPDTIDSIAEVAIRYSDSLIAELAKEKE